MIRHHISNGFYLREHGPADAAGILVYVHGLGESGLGFEGLLNEPRLADWRQLTVDMPSYGKNLWAAEPLSLVEQADGLARWIDREINQKKGGPPVVLGHSMGGVIGTLLAERHPASLRALVNIEGNISLGDCGFSSRAAKQSLDQFIRTGMDQLLAELYAEGVDDPVLRTYYPSARLCDPRAYHKNSRELVEVSEREDLARRMAALAVPGLYVAGYPRGTPERSRELLEKAGVNWRSVDNAGHWPFLDQSHVFVEELVTFLSRNP